MKTTLIGFQLLWGIISTTLAQGIYSGTIYTDAATYKGIKPSLLDLQQSLFKATGNAFQIVQTDSFPATGICIRHLRDQDVPRFPTLYHTDAAKLVSDGKNKMEISAFTWQGLTNGIYTYLDELGFRWYQPGDEHAYIPALKNIGWKGDRVFAPEFVLRTFFGTFGTPRNPFIDKQKLVDKSWSIWYRRNRFGGEYSLKGHSWNEFLWRNKAEFKAHPEYLAVVNGMRSPVNTASKFCISDTGFQHLFVADMVAQLRQQMQRQPNAIRYFISVEPSDGDGFCTCEPCRKLGSISNQVFYLANLTAIAFQKISPKAYVNLYAYYTHAAPPDFALEKNVVVQLIPYGYQHYTSPEEMIKAWKQKTDALFIYDYYGLPITNLDMPLRNGERPEKYAERIKYWYRQGIKGVTLESSYSTAATGLGLYIFCRLSWNMNENIEELIQKFYYDNYGVAAPALQQSDEVLRKENAKPREALQSAFETIAKAKLPAKTDSLRNLNLTDYKAYLHYLKLLYEFKSAEKNNIQAKAEDLMHFVYATWFRRMVHPFPVADFLLNRSEAKSYIRQNWNYLKPAETPAKFKAVSPMTEGEINRLFENDREEIRKGK